MMTSRPFGSVYFSNAMVGTSEAGLAGSGDEQAASTVAAASARPSVIVYRMASILESNEER